MPDIYGKYSLTEASKETGATQAFINRIQRATGIGGKLGKRGEKNTFSRTEVEIFYRIKLLRVIGFSFQEIKQIHDFEEELLCSEDKIQGDPDIPEFLKTELQLFILNEKCLVPDPDLARIPTEGEMRGEKSDKQLSEKRKQWEGFAQKESKRVQAFLVRCKQDKETREILERVTRYMRVQNTIKERTEEHVRRSEKIGNEIKDILRGNISKKYKK